MRTWLGPVGELMEVPSPQMGIPASADRSSEVFTALSGKRTHFLARRAYRTWSWTYNWRTPAEVEWIARVAQGSVVGPVYLYTEATETTNLAPVPLQSGGSGVVERRRVLAAGDPEVRQWIIPVHPNTSYTVSALGNGVGTVTVEAAGEAFTGFGYGPYGHGPYGGID